MRKKQNSNKEPATTQPPTKPTRKRRTNLELAGFGRDHLKTIRRISEESRVPIDQVLADVIENGLITVMPMYETMIEFRKSRETKLKNLFTRNHDEPTLTETTGRGVAEEQSGTATDLDESAGEGTGSVNGDADGRNEGDNERSGDVVIQSRFEPETDPGFVSVAED